MLKSTYQSLIERVSTLCGLGGEAALAVELPRSAIFPIGEFLSDRGKTATMAATFLLPAAALALAPVGQSAMAQTAATATATATPPATMPSVAESQQAADAAYDLIVYAGQYIAVAGEAVRGPTTIAVRDGRIVDVRAGYAPLPATRVLDLKNKIVLPGLIDAHVHFSFDQSTRIWSAMIERPEDVALAAYVNATKTLKAGFTTVRDVGSDGESVHALRDAIQNGRVDGPRILLSGTSLSIIGGHGDMSGLNRKATEAFYPYDYTGACTGAVECSMRVREAAKFGADLIKVTATGGIMSEQARGLGQHLTDEELKAIVQSAHDLGLKVASHAHGLAGVAASVRAGVDSIEHGTYLDSDTAKEMARKGTFLVPTLGLLQPKDDAAKQLTPAVLAKMAEARKVSGQNIRLAKKYGVKIAFGTDAGVSQHGLNAQQFALMVQEGPMTPAEALKSATVMAAELLGQSEQIGTLEVGKFADMIAVDANPYEDVTVLERVSVVVKDGHVVVNDM